MIILPKGRSHSAAHWVRHKPEECHIYWFSWNILRFEGCIDLFYGSSFILSKAAAVPERASNFSHPSSLNLPDWKKKGCVLEILKRSEKQKNSKNGWMRKFIPKPRCDLHLTKAAFFKFLLISRSFPVPCKKSRNTLTFQRKLFWARIGWANMVNMLLLNPQFKALPQLLSWSTACSKDWEEGTRPVLQSRFHFIITKPAGIPARSQNHPTELPEKGVVGSGRGFQTFEMDERKPTAISTVGDTIVIINTICNMDIWVFDEGRMELETTSSSLEWVEWGGNIPQ